MIKASQNTIVVAGYAGKAKPPAALGKPYTKE